MHTTQNHFLDSKSHIGVIFLRQVPMWRLAIQNSDSVREYTQGEHTQKFGSLMLKRNYRSLKQLRQSVS